MSYKTVQKVKLLLKIILVLKMKKKNVKKRKNKKNKRTSVERMIKLGNNFVIILLKKTFPSQTIR